jgi:excisionase family DNA binding protein
MPDDGFARGLTPRETARLLRISADKVRAMIRAGRLGAINTGECGRDRFVVLPSHLEAFAREHRAASPPKPTRRRRPAAIDFYPD